MSVPGTLVSTLITKHIVISNGAHRYWRLLLNQVGFVAVAEVEFRSVRTGATNVNQTCTGGTAIASSYYAPQNFVPALAFNGSITSRGWSSNTTPNPHWIGYDFVTPKSITEVAFSGTNEPTQVIKQADIQYSDNGTSWTTVYSTPSNLVLAAQSFNVYPITY